MPPIKSWLTPTLITPAASTHVVASAATSRTSGPHPSLGSPRRCPPLSCLRQKSSTWLYACAHKSASSSDISSRNLASSLPNSSDLWSTISLPSSSSRTQNCMDAPKTSMSDKCSSTRLSNDSFSLYNTCDQGPTGQHLYQGTSSARLRSLTTTSRCLVYSPKWPPPRNKQSCGRASSIPVRFIINPAPTSSSEFHLCLGEAFLSHGVPWGEAAVATCYDFHLREAQYHRAQAVLISLVLLAPICNIDVAIGAISCLNDVSISTISLRADWDSVSCLLSCLLPPTGSYSISSFNSIPLSHVSATSEAGRPSNRALFLYAF